jgi:hypothetical protein
MYIGDHLGRWALYTPDNLKSHLQHYLAGFKVTKAVEIVDGLFPARVKSASATWQPVKPNAIKSCIKWGACAVATQRGGRKPHCSYSNFT